MTDKEKELLEARFYELGRRMASFDTFFDQIKDLHEKCGSVFKEVKEAKNDLWDHKETLKGRFADIEGRYRSLENRLDDLHLHNYSVKQNHELSCKKIDALQQLQSAHCLKVNSLHEKISLIPSLKEEFSSFKAESSSQLARLQEGVKRNSERMDGLDRRFDVLRDSVSTLPSLQDQVRLISKNLEKDIGEIKTESDRLFTDFSKYVDLRFDHAFKTIYQKIDSLVIPKQDSIPSLELVSRIQDQMQTVSLDSRNASLKASNVEMQTQLQTKKIENIQLLLKNLEFSQAK